MGFADIFKIVNKLEVEIEPEKLLTAINCDEQEVKEKVLEAHKILMGLNEQNRETFKNLVTMLENS
jgi:hypothetical protein